MRGFRFRSILYSERCAHICLAPSQNSNVWRPNIHVWTHFEPIFSVSVHGWIQMTVTQLAGVRECRRKRQLSFLTMGCWLLIYWCSEDLNKQFSPSRNRFPRRTGSHKPGPFCSSSATLVRLLHVILLAVRDRQWNELPAKFKLHDTTLTDQ